MRKPATRTTSPIRRMLTTVTVALTALACAAVVWMAGTAPAPEPARLNSTLYYNGTATGSTSPPLRPRPAPPAGWVVIALLTGGVGAVGAVAVRSAPTGVPAT